MCVPSSLFLKKTITANRMPSDGNHRYEQGEHQKQTVTRAEWCGASATYESRPAAVR